MNAEDGYRLLAGKCKSVCEAIAKMDSQWTLTRGHYICPMWGPRAHWWLTAKDGTVYDPTIFQFPTPRIGYYEPFDGRVSCAECGKEMDEAEAEFESNYAFCSGNCHMRFVGL